MKWQLMTNQPCSICEVVDESNITDSWFNYTTCVEHQHLPPAMKETNRKRYLAGDPYIVYRKAFPPLR